MHDSEIILSCIPKRTAEHEVGAEGRVVVLQPRFSFPPFQRLLERWKRPHIRVKLDEIGSFLWLRCDGTQTVGELATALEEGPGQELPQARERTVEFFRTLTRSKLVVLQRRNPGA